MHANFKYRDSSSESDRLSRRFEHLVRIYEASVLQPLSPEFADSIVTPAHSDHDPLPVASYRSWHCPNVDLKAMNGNISVIASLIITILLSQIVE